MTFIKGQKAPKHKIKCSCPRCSRHSPNKGIRTKPLDMSRIFFDKIDEKIFNKYTWQIELKSDGKEYLSTKNVKNKKIYFHRMILKAKKKEFSDHINGNGLDNRRHNLRIATNAQNNYNRRPKYQFKGVFFRPKNNKYVAQIMFKRKTFYLGIFELAEDAASVYNEKAKELFGKFAWLNKI